MDTSRTLFRRLARAAACAAFVGAAVSSAALADGPTQPDPPVPMEALPSAGALPPADAQEPDCRCSALYARDLEGRIQGHVERWESLSHSAVAAGASGPASHPAAVHTAAFVDGVVGFPLHEYRLAEDGTQGQPL